MEESKNIINKKSKNVIIKLLADKASLSILSYAMDISTSIQEIIHNTGLPYSTVYKKIKWLKKNELLFLHTMKISKKGKKFALYKSNISRIVVIYEKGKLEVSIREN